MTELVPASFFVRLNCGVEYREQVHLAAVDRLLDLPPRCRLVVPGLLDQNATSRLQVRAGWNKKGLALAIEVPPSPSVTRLSPVLLWIDTRCTQNVHRASRYCLSLQFQSRNRKSSEMKVTQIPINRAREQATDVATDKIQTLCHYGDYSSHDELEIWLPIQVLPGFDPQASNRIGFFCTAGQGEERSYFSGGQQFPYDEDPSMWHSLELLPKS